MTPTLIHPTEWPWALQSPPVASSESTPWGGALVRYWSGTSALMEQPPLDHHYVVMHLGGAKRVTRRLDGPHVCAIAEPMSLTLVPAGTAFVWRTEGPIAFAHLYVKPDRLERYVEEAFDADGRGSSLIEAVGCRDRLLELLFEQVLAEVRLAAAPSTLLLDSMLESFCVKLAQSHSSFRLRRHARVEALAPHRLRRVLDYIETHLGSDIGLADLAKAGGSSQFHFSRAFRIATGRSPYRYLVCRRIEYACVLLKATNDPLQQISAACGFNSSRQLAMMFRQAVGVTPKRFRTALMNRSRCAAA